MADLSDAIATLLKDIEKLCVVIDVDADNLKILSLLHMLLNEVENAIDSMKDDEEYTTLDFSYNLHREKKRAVDLDFSDYDS